MYMCLTFSVKILHLVVSTASKLSFYVQPLFTIGIFVLKQVQFH